MSWENWSGRVTASPSKIVPVATEADVVAAIKEAVDAGRRIRAVGAGHSHSPLVATDATLIDPTALSGVVGIDSTRCEALVLAGTRISDLGHPLREAGFAMKNQGDIDRQAIAGAVATGTHGTGTTLQNISASVSAVRLVLASGDVVDCDATHESDLFEVARLALGAVGIATKITLAVRGAYKLEEHIWLEDFDDVVDRLDELTGATRHFEFFWMPSGRRVACKRLEETDAPPQYPLASEGRRLAWSYEVLATDRPDKHTEMEYSISAEDGPACMRALRDLIRRDFADLEWPLEYRTVAADEIWLSMAYGRPTVTISVHQGIDRDETPLFRACEAVFREFGGRPHWGKLHYLRAADLATRYEHWEDWWRIRDRYDPAGVFLNGYLESLRSD